VFQPEVHTLLRQDPDIVAAKAAGELRVRGRTKLSLEDCLADPAVADVITNGMSTNAAAAKHGISQPTLWAKVKRAKDLISPPKPKPAPTTITPTSPAKPQLVTPTQDPEISAVKSLVEAIAHRKGLTVDQVKSMI
jgi:transposase-like protein